MKRIEHLTREYVKSLPKLRAPAGYIYVLQDMLHGVAFKIGKTIHPYRRCYEFGVNIPYDIKPVLVIETKDASEAEKYLHRRFSGLRMFDNMEWFKLSESDLQTISELNLDRMVKKRRKLASNAKRRRTQARRRKTRDSGWLEKDFVKEEWDEEGLTDEDAEIDRDIDYDILESEEAYELNWESEYSDVYLPAGDIEETIESEILSGKNLAGVILNGKDLSNRDVSFANLWGAELSHT